MKKVFHLTIIALIFYVLVKVSYSSRDGYLLSISKKSHAFNPSHREFKFVAGKIVHSSCLFDWFFLEVVIFPFVNLGFTLAI